MRSISFLVCVVLLAFCRPCVAAEDLEALSESPIWQVRYCVATKFDAPSTDARRTLERLSVDDIPAVARQAFSIYTRIFVELDPDIVKKAFARGDFDLVGVTLPDRKVFETPEFWLRELTSSPNAPGRVRAIRAIGMSGTAAAVDELSKHLDSTNPYVLCELALAFHRLGDSQKYLAALDTILAMPTKETFSYQNQAVEYLIQTHPGRARTAWEQVHKQFGNSQEHQPNWVYSHIVQESRLP